MPATPRCTTCWSRTTGDFSFTDQGWEDYQSRADQRKVLLRINRLLTEAHRSPNEGAGRPERLRANWAGWWSRRIDQEHRLVYTVEVDVITIAQCRYHY